MIDESNFIISIDPGSSQMGVAVFDHEGNLLGVETIKKLGYGPEVKEKFENVLSELIWENYQRTVGDAIVLIELPSPRYFGRPSVGIIRLLHQIVYLVQALSRWADRVVLVDAFEWNYKDHGNKGRQYTDKDKNEKFLETFTQYSRKETNTDQRDAALMALWTIKNRPELLTDDYIT